MAMERQQEEAKLKLYQKEINQLIKANKLLSAENTALHEQVEQLERTVAVFESLIELSQQEMTERDSVIGALERTHQLSHTEIDGLQQTLDAYKQVSEMSKTELERAENVIKAHEEIERLSWEERRVIDNELLLAQKIQFGLMSKTWPALKGLQIDASYLPTTHLGGDIYAINVPQENMLSVFVADVAGHGTQAALITMIAKTLIDNLSAQYTDPGELLMSMNTQLYRIIKELKTFMTALLLVFHPETNELYYANGGHPVPLFLSNGKVKPLKTTGTILGAFEDMQYRTEKIQLKPGDYILAYTDGLLEEARTDGTMYEQTRLEQCVSRITNSTTCAEANVMILKDLQDFSGRTRMEDDVSLISIRYTPEVQ